jgi:hypothetical protein
VLETFLIRFRKYSLIIFASLKSGSYVNRHPGCVAGLRALIFHLTL